MSGLLLRQRRRGPLLRRDILSALAVSHGDKPISQADDQRRRTGAALRTSEAHARKASRRRKSSDEHQRQRLGRSGWAMTATRRRAVARAMTDSDIADRDDNIVARLRRDYYVKDSDLLWRRRD